LADQQQETTRKQQEYWKKNIRLIKMLLVIWALVSLVAAILLAVPFSNVPFFGVNLSFWFAQQGSILIFLVLIFYYAKKMDKLDEEYDVKEVILTKESKDKGV
jgi:putative solute:sodium symporter small subunit